MKCEITKKYKSLKVKILILTGSDLLQLEKKKLFINDEKPFRAFLESVP